jgi:hypothetical protein
MHLLASPPNWGSVPDWIAAIGSVLAFAGFAIAFIWEVRKRRLDDEQVASDRRDAVKRHARLVYTNLNGGSDTQTRLIIHNQGTGPIIDIDPTVWIWSEDQSGKLRQIRLDRREPDVTELGADRSGEVWLWFADGERIAARQDFFPQIEFTDCEGIRWRRQNNQQPIRVT